MRTKEEYIVLALAILLIRFIVLLNGVASPWFRSLKRAPPRLGPAAQVAGVLAVNLVAVAGLAVTHGRALPVVGGIFLFGLALGLLEEVAFFVGEDLARGAVFAALTFAYQAWFVAFLFARRQPMAFFLLPRLAWSAVAAFNRAVLLKLNSPGY